MVEFYTRIPKGPAPLQKPPMNPFERYRRAYWDENASATPLVHAILALGLLGYAIDYNFHLKDHKNKEHH
jgi:F-type H+-transporting ATPase subunit f